MSDRRAQQYPPSAHVALASQWSGSGQYQTSYASQDQYSSAYQNHHPSLRGASHSPHSVPGYDAMSAQAQAIAAQYQLNDGQIHYSHIPTSDRRSSMSVSQYGAHAVESHYGSPGSQVAGRAHSHSHSHSYPHSSSHATIPHSPSLGYSQTQTMTANAYATPLSSSPQSPSMSNMATAQYASQAAYAQQVSSYPASPPRPFACDMCALSFNRQHDLKRHRDTHTGEKPFFCNGGCGKTFTRKDALKRHQLVKRCGIDDNSS
ncbi:transcription factor [Ganoderma sinense ZZ0214-1]|uniref:Transcription factor n=1 Tax=Ganoderma sinense ZZ0214-1 TaxID=1077348 RepID=A0A2G8SQZ7_9APHY|nr:transcription factor [Ganoderma sinense ZZ0214-1]